MTPKHHGGGMIFIPTFIWSQTQIMRYYKKNSQKIYANPPFWPIYRFY